MAKADGPVDYETFAHCDRRTQVGLFNAVTPENRANLVRTQAERWLAANRPSLTAEQVSAADAALAVITPELYRPETTVEQREAITQTVLDRLASLFTREQIWRFVGAGAPYIPPHS